MVFVCKKLFVSFTQIRSMIVVQIFVAEGVLYGSHFCFEGLLGFGSPSLVWSGICTCNCIFERTWNQTCCVPWIQEALSMVDKDQPSSLAAVALKEMRLIFTWLDGEAQQVSPFVCQACQCFPSLVVVQFTFVVVNGLINLRVMYVMCMVLGHNLF
ncbi:uncharacterized protein LOC114260583 isoform X2 [Camellia sinensis]|uniref:uncharacterized protein LOC114260583 isoform X2 n=1 Tax=Camellia sinensis TaxID=4442 RepID=UPI001036000A|nr:uncharacterized protein LOC114260583 isoform X2 [Camellia sinensis]